MSNNLIRQTDLSVIPAVKDLTMSLAYGSTSASSVTTICSGSGEGWFYVNIGCSDDIYWKHVEIKINGTQIAAFRAPPNGGFAASGGLFRYTTSFAVAGRTASGTGSVYAGVQKFV